MKEKDIVWESGVLWVGKTAKGKYSLFKIEGVISRGFLQFNNKAQSIENGEVLLSRPDLVAKLIHGKH